MSAGKGDKRRPLQVPIEVFVKNWDRIFGKQKRVKKKKFPYILPAKPGGCCASAGCPGHVIFDQDAENRLDIPKPVVHLDCVGTDHCKISHEIKN